MMCGMVTWGGRAVREARMRWRSGRRDEGEDTDRGCALLSWRMRCCCRIIMTEARQSVQHGESGGNL